MLLMFNRLNACKYFRVIDWRPVKRIWAQFAIEVCRLSSISVYRLLFYEEIIKQVTVSHLQLNDLNTFFHFVYRVKP